MGEDDFGGQFPTRGHHDTKRHARQVRDSVKGEYPTAEDIAEDLEAKLDTERTRSRLGALEQDTLQYQASAQALRPFAHGQIIAAIDAMRETLYVYMDFFGDERPDDAWLIYRVDVKGQHAHAHIHSTLSDGNYHGKLTGNSFETTPFVRGQDNDAWARFTRYVLEVADNAEATSSIFRQILDTKKQMEDEMIRWAKARREQAKSGKNAYQNVIDTEIEGPEYQRPALTPEDIGTGGL